MRLLQRRFGFHVSVCRTGGGARAEGRRERAEGRSDPWSPLSNLPSPISHLPSLLIEPLEPRMLLANEITWIDPFPGDQDVVGEAINDLG